MASLVNAIRNLEGDRFWLFKTLIFASPIMLIYKNEAFINNSINIKIIILALILILHMGCGIIISNRNINNKSPILPNLFAIHEIILHGIVSFLLAAPSIVVAYLLFQFIINSLTEVENLYVYIILSVILIITVPFFVIPSILYSVRYKINDALNFNIILKASGNVSVSFVSFIIQYALIFIIASYVIFLLIKAMMGEVNLILNGFISFLITMSYFIFISFCSDLYEDVIPPVKSKRNIL